MGKEEGGKEEAEEEEEEIGNVKSFILGVLSCSKRAVSVLMKSSPLETCDEVSELMEYHKMTSGHLFTMYKCFQRLKQSEEDEIITSAMEINCESVQQLVQERRRWVARLLRCLLRLGGCELDGTLCWDEFLWIFVRFSSLSEPELGQTLFMLIVNELESDTLHYLTREQMAEFYLFYEQCTIKAFNSRYINFEKLPLSRYYVSDFCELCTRFRSLMNPIIHLQQQIQGHLPNVEFWDMSDHSEFTRKISLEFFTMKKIRVYLRGDPPFRETCDMLAPDALGTEIINQDQWYLRVWGLKQWSVWGEQFTPEKAEEEELKILEMKAAMEAEIARRAELIKEAVRQGLPNPVFKEAIPGMPPIPENPPDGSQPLMPTTVPPLPPPGKGGSVGSTAQALRALGQVAGTVREDGLAGRASHAAQGFGEYDPEELSLKATATIADLSEPNIELPPAWMKGSGCTIAPAPQIRTADPPLWYREHLGVPYQTASSWYSSPSLNASLNGGMGGPQDTMDSWGAVSLEDGDFSSLHEGDAGNAAGRSGSSAADIAANAAAQSALRQTGGMNSTARKSDGFRVTFDDKFASGKK